MLTLKTNDKKEPKALKAEVVRSEPKVHFVQKTIGQDTYLVMAQSAVQPEDEWANLYFTTAHQSNLYLQPPFEPDVLLSLVQTNNILLQCIEAMEVNIDGTGIEFVPTEPQGKVDEKERKRAQAFFEEPCPNQSFVKIRRKLRRQLEQVGYAFLEVLRTLNGDIVGLRNVDTQQIRFVKLDKPVLVEKTLVRDGKEVKIKIWERERRFAQRIAMKQFVYYREFGSSRQVNRDTGDWEDETKLPPEQRGSELICFGIHPDHRSPYSLPRWINQLPSVIGSRKAEEQNLQFLDSGGLPPAIIFVQGGTLAKEASDQLRTYLSGQNKNKYRAVVVEAQSSSGSLDSAGNVQVRVERFGAASAQDAMFQKYDVSTEEHIQKGFRLPPLFLGKPQDYNMATAITAYMVAEEQVFQPERSEFDAVINSTLMKEMGFKSLKIKSNPITLKDVANQLQGLQIAVPLATRESILKEINSSTGMDLELAAVPMQDQVTHTVGEGGVKETSTVAPGAPTFSQTPHEKLPGTASMQQANPIKNVVTMPQPGKTPGTPGAAPGRKAAMELIEMACGYAVMSGLMPGEVPVERQLVLKQEIASLEGQDREAFDTLLAQYTFGADDPDLVALVK